MVSRIARPFYLINISPYQKSTTLQLEGPAKAGKTVNLPPMQVLRPNPSQSLRGRAMKTFVSLNLCLSEKITVQFSSLVTKFRTIFRSFCVICSCMKSSNQYQLISDDLSIILLKLSCQPTDDSKVVKQIHATRQLYKTKTSYYLNVTALSCSKLLIPQQPDSISRCRKLVSSEQPTHIIQYFHIMNKNRCGDRNIQVYTQSASIINTAPGEPDRVIATRARPDAARQARHLLPIENEQVEHHTMFPHVYMQTIVLIQVLQFKYIFFWFKITI